jgi:hypothetical protein
MPVAPRRAPEQRVGRDERDQLEQRAALEQQQSARRRRDAAESPLHAGSMRALHEQVKVLTS